MISGGGVTTEISRGVAQDVKDAREASPLARNEIAANVTLPSANAAICNVCPLGFCTR